jgi:hypothetical protein
MNKTKFAIGLILIFLLGGLTGAFALKLYYRHDFRGGPPRHADLRERVDFIMQRLTDDLDLSPDQAAQVRPLVETSERAVSELRERISPEMRRIHDQSFEAIREKLDPNQQKKLDEIRDRMKNYRRRTKPK